MILACASVACPFETSWLVGTVPLDGCMGQGLRSSYSHSLHDRMSVSAGEIQRAPHELQSR